MRDHYSYLLISSEGRRIPGRPHHAGASGSGDSLRIADKYLVRKQNIERAWVRIHHHLPETVETGQPLDILEFSTAHGAMLEIWKHLGHRVRGADFSGWPDSYAMKPRMQDWLRPVFQHDHQNPRAKINLGWIYQPIVESTGIQVDLFDAGKLPYAYADKSFDVTCCYQAIEAYADPDRWTEVVDEFCRITRQTIKLGFNPPPHQLRSNMAHQAEVRDAIEAIRRFDRNGFRTIFMEFGNTNAGHHPTAAKLVECSPANTRDRTDRQETDVIKHTCPERRYLLQQTRRQL